jgi:hypothetical protein
LRFPLRWLKSTAPRLSLALPYHNKPPHGGTLTSRLPFYPTLMSIWSADDAGLMEKLMAEVEFEEEESTLTLTSNCSAKTLSSFAPQTPIKRWLSLTPCGPRKDFGTQSPLVDRSLGTVSVPNGTAVMTKHPAAGRGPITKRSFFLLSASFYFCCSSLHMMSLQNPLVVTHLPRFMFIGLNAAMDNHSFLSLGLPSPRPLPRC